ncbi:MAG: DUF1707 SHOCT-like domain-containing protein [Spirochaeta sp.]
MSAQDSSGSPLSERQDQAIDLLNRCYADEYLDTDEFEDRVSRVNLATSIRRLEDVMADLPKQYQLPTLRRTSAPSLGSTPHNITNIMGDRHCGTELVETGNITNFTLMGDTVFDLRQIPIPPGEMHLNITCIMGDVKVMLPQGVGLENRVNAVMADVKVKGDSGVDTHSTLFISGFAFMADVKIRYY